MGFRHQMLNQYKSLNMYFGLLLKTHRLTIWPSEQAMIVLLAITACMPLLLCENMLQLALRVLSSARYQTRRSKTPGLALRGDHVRHCDSPGPIQLCPSSRCESPEISGYDGLFPKSCNFRLFKSVHTIPTSSPLLHIQLVPRQLYNPASDYSRLRYHSFARFE